jgi:hypothetical protein
MRIIPRFKWTARKAGGLFVGLRYSFPCTLIEMNPATEAEVRLTQVWLSIGFGPCTLHLDFQYNFRKAD